MTEERASVPPGEERAAPEPVTAVIDTAGAWLPLGLEQVEAGLSAAVDNGGALSEDAVTTLKAGGKRMRPMLVLLCAGPGGGEAAVRTGIAVELVHMASLVHDDVLDRAPLRRGLPTVFARSGRDRATSVGDQLFATAFRVLVDGGDQAAVAELSRTAVDLARGELMQRRGAFNLRVSEEEYFERCSLKTGRLFEAACALGRSTVDPGQADLVSHFGNRIGLAFQMLDDVLDIAGPPERTGKARGTDLLDGTVTLPYIVAAKVDAGLLEIDLHALDETTALGICRRIEATGAFDEVRRRAMELIDEAKSELTSAGLDLEQRELLELIADGVVLRYS